VSIKSCNFVLDVGPGSLLCVGFGR